MYSGGFPEQVVIDLDQYPLNNGVNTLAIEVHNYSSNSSDLSCIPFLTLGYNIMTQGTNNPNELMELPNSFLHTNFRISSNGETIVLSDENENVLDSVFTNTLETDISFWSTGNSGFGYGDNDDNTNISQVISLYVRKDFLITNASNLSLIHI